MVKLHADDNNAYSVSGGALPKTFIADHFHFHWGKVDSRGSEHTVNGQGSPMEVRGKLWPVLNSDQFQTIIGLKPKPVSNHDQSQTMTVPKLWLVSNHNQPQTITCLKPYPVSNHDQSQTMTCLKP